MHSLKDKIIIVTGAARGIGRSITLECIKYGAIVFALDINKLDLVKLKNEIKNDQIKTYVVDVSKYEEINNLFLNLKKDKINPDCLVNNAGIYYGQSIFKYNNSEIDNIININVKSAIYFSKIFAATKIKNKEKGVILNISSVSGQDGSSDAIYGLSKSALIGLTKSNAINFSPYIRVNAIAPGIVDTQMLRKVPKDRVNNYRKSELMSDLFHLELEV